MPGRLIFKTTADGSNAATERLRIDSGGKILIGSGAIANPKVTTAGAIDTSNSDWAIVMGGSGSGNRANSANKDGRFAGAHYTNAEEPIGLVRSYSTSSANEVHIGGGSSLINAATQLSLYTATNTTTTGGTERLRIGSNGEVSFKGGPLEEKFESRSGDVGDDANFNVLNGNVLKYTGAANAAGARTINVRGNGSVAYNDLTSTASVVSLTVIHRPNGNDYINAYTIDGNSNGQNSYTITTEFLGGSAPSSASSADLEVHNITLFKNADKNYTFLVAVNEYS
jgi:hypothetical protein